MVRDDLRNALLAYLALLLELNMDDISESARAGVFSLSESLLRLAESILIGSTCTEKSTSQQQRGTG